jgi:hypothetical protein
MNLVAAAWLMFGASLHARYACEPSASLTIECSEPRSGRFLAAITRHHLTASNTQFVTIGFQANIQGH